MTKIVFISDTHNKHRSLNMPDGDIVVHSGDYTNLGRFDEVIDFLCWFNGLQYKHKIFINGNHEFYVEKHEEWITGYLSRESKNTYFLNHESVELEGLKFFGSPYTPEFFNWAYMYNREDGEKIWKDIPNDTDVLITHGPPKGILDRVNIVPPYYNVHSGCEYLLKRVMSIKPKVHVFGHIHEHYGVSESAFTKFVNASNLAKYGVLREPIVLEV